MSLFDPTSCAGSQVSPAWKAGYETGYDEGLIDKSYNPAYVVFVDNWQAGYILGRRDGSELRREMS